MSKTVGAGAAANYVYGATSHRLLDVSGVTRIYDSNGNTTHPYSTWSGATRFIYDERNRLRERHTGNLPPSLTHEYSYNARGERVFKNDNNFANPTRAFAYDESGRLLAELDQNSAAIQEYIWLDDLPVGLLDGGVLHHIQPDHLGSPRKVIQSSTNTALWNWPILNNPFGETAPNQDPDGNGLPFVFNLRFPGQYFDSETGLHYNYFRDYEPGTGRYVESDPIGLEGGIGTFSYALGRPTLLTDPKGQAVVLLEAAAVGAGVCYLAYYAATHRRPENSSAAARPSGWPPNLPHPSDPAPAYTCTSEPPCSPPPQAPDPNSGCRIRYAMMVASCNKMPGMMQKTLCRASAILFLLACEAAIN